MECSYLSFSDWHFSRHKIMIGQLNDTWSHWIPVISIIITWHFASKQEWAFCGNRSAKWCSRPNQIRPIQATDKWSWIRGNRKQLTKCSSYSKQQHREIVMQIAKSQEKKLKTALAILLNEHIWLIHSWINSKKKKQQFSAHKCIDCDWHSQGKMTNKIDRSFSRLQLLMLSIYW